MTTLIEIRDAELIEALQKEVESRGIGQASLVLVGGVDTFRISNMPADDATADNIRDYNQPGEMMGTGQVRDGRVHVHATFGVEGDLARAGHLHAAQVGTWFVDVYLNEVD